MKEKITAFILTLIATSIMLIFNFPLIWMGLMTFKPTDMIFKEPFRVIFPITFEHFGRVNYVVGTTYYMSLIVAISSTLITLAISIPAAYSISRFKTGGQNLLGWLLTLRITPAIIVLIPMYIMFYNLKLLDTPYALILIYQTFNVPFAVFVLKSFIDDIPVDYEESALTDGYTQFQVLRKITLKLSMPAIFTVLILTFVMAWNEYLFALILSITKSRTWRVGAQCFAGTSGPGIEFGPLATSGLLGMIPPLILAFIVRKHLLRSFTLGIIKR